MVTDPPYGVEYDAEWRKRSGINTGSQAVYGKVMNDDKADWREAWALFPGEVAYIWHASVMSPEVVESLMVCNFERRALIVWGKSNFAISRGHYHHQHEPCWYVVKKGATAHWVGDRKQTTLWQAYTGKTAILESTGEPFQQDKK
jgi:DNA modification methylase